MVVLIAMIHNVSHPDHTEAVVVPRLPHHAHLLPHQAGGVKLEDRVMVCCVHNIILIIRHVVPSTCIINRMVMMEP